MSKLPEVIALLSVLPEHELEAARTYVEQRLLQLRSRRRGPARAGGFQGRKARPKVEPPKPRTDRPPEEVEFRRLQREVRAAKKPAVTGDLPRAVDTELLARYQLAKETWFRVRGASRTAGSPGELPGLPPVEDPSQEEEGGKESD